jgi:hypothetical protein
VSGRFRRLAPVQTATWHRPGVGSEQ